ncbi:MAG: CRTAC1 family protein [Pseudomonadota bacterium]
MYILPSTGGVFMIDRGDLIRIDSPYVSIGLYQYLILLVVIVFWAGPVSGSIKFEEVTEQAGISRLSPTAGASWGDFNGDGWPDLWVGNHHLSVPSLYVNRGDGTFLDVASSVFPGLPRADFHGAAWADFDNDGDQDLLVVTGGGAGRGYSQNFLFVNQNGLLVDHAKQLGLDYPLGRGRTPLWLDADGDGQLDVVIINRPRPDGQAPSALFRQIPNGFENYSHEFEFLHGKRSLVEKIMDLASNAIHFRLRRGPGSIIVKEGFVQLADLSGNGSVDLIAYSKPMRVFSIDEIPFKEITNTIGFPSIGEITDVAIEDFTGDLNPDMYLARSHSVSDVIRTGAFSLRGSILASGKERTSKGLQFRSKGKVNFEFYTPWKDPSDPLKNLKPVIFLGAVGEQVGKSSVTLSPADKIVWGPVPEEKTEKREISIDYDVTSGLWTMLSSVRYLNFKLKSTEPIEQMKPIGFTPAKGVMADKLLIQQEGNFTSRTLSPAAVSLTACRSIAAADFDNDMDIDLYLVCTGPAGNLPNLLYENDGTGNFSVVRDAGGASGSESGRGESVVTADFDRDGFLDLFVTNGFGPPPFPAEGPHQLFRNKGNLNHWLELDLEGNRSNRDGVGTHILLEAGGIRQVRTQGGGMHYMSQHHQRVHFGLGKHTTVNEIIIRWPSGEVQRLENVMADQILLVREPK